MRRGVKSIYKQSRASVVWVSLSNRKWLVVMVINGSLWRPAWETKFFFHSASRRRAVQLYSGSCAIISRYRACGRARRSHAGAAVLSISSYAASFYRYIYIYLRNLPRMIAREDFCCNGVDIIISNAGLIELYARLLQANRKGSGRVSVRTYRPRILRGNSGKSFLAMEWNFW